MIRSRGGRGLNGYRFWTQGVSNHWEAAGEENAEHIAERGVLVLVVRKLQRVRRNERRSRGGAIVPISAWARDEPRQMRWINDRAYRNSVNSETRLLMRIMTMFGKHYKLYDFRKARCISACAIGSVWQYVRLKICPKCLIDCKRKYYTIVRVQFLYIKIYLFLKSSNNYQKKQCISKTI